MESDPVTGRLHAERLPDPIHIERHSQGPAISASISDDGERWFMIATHPGTKGLSLTHGAFDSSRTERIDGLATGSSEPQASPDGQWLGWGNWHGLDAVVTRLGGSGPPLVFPAGASARVAFTPDNRMIAVGGSQALRFYEAGTWRLLHEIPRVPVSTHPPNFAFTPDSRLCAVALNDHVRLLDIVTAEELGTLPADQRALSCVAFSPDGRYLAAASQGHHVLLWDIAKLRGRLRELGLDWESPGSNNR
jgi:WD40 repeat protein